MGFISETVNHLIATNPLSSLAATGYEYILHGRGISLRAKNKYFDICLPTVVTEVRGLPIVKPKLDFTPLPGHLLSAIIAHAQNNNTQEVLYYIINNGRKLTAIIGKYGTAASIEDIVDPFPAAQIVAQIHSHGRFGAYFSPTDNANELEFRLFGVVGKVNSIVPEVIFRIGVYGHHFTVQAKEAFSPLPPCIDRFADVEEGTE